MLKKIVVLLILTIFSFTLGFSWYVWDHFVHTAASADPTEVTYEVNKGKVFSHVAMDLEAEGIVKNAQLFSWYARLKGKAGQMKVGEYLFSKDMTPDEVLNVLVSGKSIGRPFTVSEGLNIYEISELYEREGFGKREDFLQLCEDPVFLKGLLNPAPENCEGYLFPETYSLTKFTTLKELMSQMIRNFEKAYNEVIPQSQIQGLSKNEIVTLASIVEKETGAAEERPLVSSVFHNRLKRGMLLQTDPTILYGIAAENKKVILRITREDIRRPTKYNTYVIKGLPPGPIANPGKEALLAAVRPATSDYLFFVSHNDGTHKFSETYEEHNKAVRQFQLDPKAREGKSWRDLNKKKTE